MDKKAPRSPDVIADGLLDALIGLESDVRVANQGGSDPARLRPGGNHT